MNTTVQLSTLQTLALVASPKIQARFAEQSAEGIVNPIVLAELLEVRPQMIYNYIRKGKFSQAEADSSTGFNTTQKKVIDLREANVFAAAYVGRKAAKAAKVEAELLGEVE